MSAPPQPDVYKPPPETSCEVFESPVDLIEGSDRLHLRLHYYRGKIVHFAIMQITLVHGEEKHVARIDCCGGTIHRHQFNQAGVDTYDHRVIVDIPAKNGWDVVHNGYTEAYDTMFNEWEANLERWRA